MFDEPITSFSTFYYRIIKSMNDKVYFGITDRNENLSKKSSARSHKSVVCYEAKTGSCLGSFGKYISSSFSQGDIIKIEVDPIKSFIKFYRNDRLSC